MGGSTSNRFILLKVIGKILKWYLFIALPVSFAFALYLQLNVTDVNSLVNKDYTEIMRSTLKEIIGKYPFVEQIAKILSKSFHFKELKFNSIVNDIIQSLVCYTLIDWLKYCFNVRKDSAKIETKVSKVLKLAIIYTTWFFLTAYVSNVVLNKLFDLLDQLPQADLTSTKIIFISLFFLMAVLVFRYRTKERVLLCSLWTLSEKIVFPIITTFFLSLMGYWAYNIYSTSSGTDRYDMFIPIILYVLIAAGIDYLKDRTRFGIVSLVKK